jgi:hypothetical protein
MALPLWMFLYVLYLRKRTRIDAMLQRMLLP